MWYASGGQIAQAGFDGEPGGKGQANRNNKGCWWIVVRHTGRWREEQRAPGAGGKVCGRRLMFVLVRSSIECGTFRRWRATEIRAVGAAGGGSHVRGFIVYRGPRLRSDTWTRQRKKRTYRPGTEGDGAADRHPAAEELWRRTARILEHWQRWAASVWMEV